MTAADGAAAVAGAVGEHLRPGYHLRPFRGYMNDPNGPIEAAGLVHLYFQYRGTLDHAEPVLWGHATSEDYVRWKLQRPAMASAPDGLDRDGCFSGNTVLDDGRIRAFYSGYLESSPYQSVLTAVSDDGGRSFGQPERAVPDPDPGDQVTMFRDPFVWREIDGWHMAVGCGRADGRACVLQFRSDDLRTWTRQPDLASLPRQVVGGSDTGAAWECPQVLDLDGRRIAVVSAWSLETGPLRVLSFDAAEEPVPVPVDHGTNFYAASVIRDSRFGPLMFGWLTEGRDSSGWAEGWAGVISLARQVWLGPDGSLRSAPVPSIDTLRSESPLPADGASVGSQCEIALAEGSGRVVLHFGDDERLVIDVDEAAGTVRLDRTRASLAPWAHRGGAVVEDAFDPSTGRPAVRLFVDGSVVELFTSAGRVLSSRVYPTTPPPWRIEAPDNAHVWELRRNA